MGLKKYTLLLFFFSFFTSIFSQKKLSPDTTFDYAYWYQEASKHFTDEGAKQEFISSARATFIANQRSKFISEINSQIQLAETEHYHMHVDGEENLVWITPTEPSTPSSKYGVTSINSTTDCINIDFENSTALQTVPGWTYSTGYNPGFGTPNTGICCPNANHPSITPAKDFSVVTGGVDYYGGFSVLGGGTKSLKLGSEATGGRADRIAYTLSVTPNNANFKYRYALVLNDPQGSSGHDSTLERPRFEARIIGANACSSYSVETQTAGGAGFTSVTKAKQFGGGNVTVLWKNWETIAVDLTPFIGNTVTIQFTVHDCGPSGHFAYAYIDGDCGAWELEKIDTVCVGTNVNVCAPEGFKTYTWVTSGGVIVNTNRCFTTNVPGTYSCITTMITQPNLTLACNGPVFVQKIVNRAVPVIDFTPTPLASCAKQFTFTDGAFAVPGSGLIQSLTWRFGDNTFSTSVSGFPLGNPVHVYPASGTYSVKLKGTSTYGCSDSITKSITIYPTPTVAFSPPAYCTGLPVSFVNNSSAVPSSIIGYTWNLSGGSTPTSNIANPVSTYTNSGTYSISLTIESSDNCIETKTQTLSILPPPVLSFTAHNKCSVNGTAFAPDTYTSVAFGSIDTYTWNFGDGSSTSNAPNPVHAYALPGTYTVIFSATTDHHCTDSDTAVFIIAPSPSVAFSSFSINPCEPQYTFALTSSVVPASATGFSYHWDFGSIPSSTNTNVSGFTHTFTPSVGDFTVRLIGSAQFTTGLSCGDTAIQHIKVYPYPNVNITIPSECENAAFTPSSTSSGGVISQWNWNFGDGSPTSTLQAPTHFYSLFDTYTITLNVVSDVGCLGTFTAGLTAYPNPTASFAYSTIDNCSLPYTYTNNSGVSSVGSSSISNYIWDFGGVSTSFLQNPGTVAFPGYGDYTVSLVTITNHNCRDTMKVNILVYPKPDLFFDAQPNCVDKAINFTSTYSISPIPSAANSIVSFIWDYGDGNFNSSPTAPPHNYPSEGTYTVSYTAVSNMNCITTLTTELEVYPLPIIDFSVAPEFCLGNVSVFSPTGSVTAPSFINGYSWGFGDGSNQAMFSIQTTTYTYVNYGTYSVTLWAASDHECQSAITKTVTVYPVPTASFNASGGCLNVVSSFTDNSYIADPINNNIASWNWSFGEGAFSSIQNPSYTYTNAAIKQPTLTLTSNHSCTNSAVGSVTIFPLPTIAFDPPDVCTGTAVQFTNNSSVATGTVNSFAWNFGDGTPTVSASVPSHTYAPGVYIVTVTIGTDNGCINTSTTDISIFAYPEALITPTSNICVNDNAGINLNVFINSTLPDAVASHTLSYGDGSQNISTATAPYLATHTYTAFNIYTITLAAESSYGCVKTFTNSITVYPKPFADFTATKFCEGDITVFTNSSTIPSGTITSHLWSFGDATPNSNLSSVTHSYSSAQVYTVQLTEFSANTDITCSSSAVKVITINPLPIPAFSSNSVCAGSPTSFNNTSIGGNTWAWDFENTGTSNNSLQNPTHTYTAAGTYTAELRAETIFGCRDSVWHEVRVYANPTASFITNNVCFGLPTTFTNLSTSGELGAASYSWNLANGQAANNTQDPVYTYTTAGNYFVQLVVTNTANCTNAFTSTMAVYPLPNISYNAQDVCLGTPIQFTNTATITSGSIATKQWQFGDNTSTVTLSPPIHTYSVEGLYTSTLTAISDKGCVKTYTDDVFIHPYPTATLFPINNACVNSQALINVNASITYGSIQSHTLSFGDGAQITSTAALAYIAPHTYTAYNVNNYNITLSTKSDFGCAKNFTTSIIIYPRPFVSFTDSSICFGDSTKFVSTSTIPSGYSISGLTWSFGEGVSSSTLNPAKHKYASPGTYFVTLTANNFINPGLTCSASLQRSITIRPLPTPIFTANTVCYGTSTTFTNSTPGSGNTWQWTLLSNPLVTSPFYTLSFPFPAPGVYTVNLRAKNSFGCIKDTTRSITVLTPPTSSFTANEVCLGNPTLFNNLSTPGEGSLSQLTYTWNVQNGVPPITDPPFTYTYNTAGSHIVTLITKNSVGCTNAFTSTVMVNYLPDVYFFANEVCLNVPTQFTNATTIPSGSNVAWNWNFDNNSVWDDQSFEPTHTYTSSGVFTCLLQAESDKGCTSTKALPVYVRENPTADFSYPLKPCLNDPIQFTNLSTSPNGTITSYSWDFTSDGTIDNTTPNPNNVYTVGGVIHTKLSVKTNYGCVSDITKTLYLNPKPKAVFNAESTSGCPTMCTKFISLSTIASGSIVSTEWDFGDGDVPSIGTTPVHCFNTGGYNVSIKLTSDSGCVTTYMAPAYINVYTNPTAGFDVFPSELDEDEPNFSVISNSPDAATVRYLVSDGTTFNTFNFEHTIKNLDTRLKPMVVQVVKNQHGCVDTTYKVLDLKPSFNIYFPDVFTPNGDGLNDVFQAKGIGILQFHMRIYDRWGHMVFESNDFNDSWDGRTKGGDKPIKQDVYVWKADVMDIFGKTHRYYGHVTMLPESGD